MRDWLPRINTPSGNIWFYYWSAFVLIVICVFLLYRLYRRFVKTIPPDPWEDEIDLKTIPENELKPVCEECLRPIDNPSQHYCPNCNHITGEFSRYIPFVNIPFNNVGFGLAWKKITARDFNILKKGYYLLFIILGAPIVIVAGTIVLVWNKFRKKPEKEKTAV